MERHIFDPNQPQSSMSLMNLRNVIRSLHQGDLMPLRPRASMILDDMEYPSDAAAQAEWSGTGVTVSSSTTKQEGDYALQVVIDVTGNRTLTRTLALDLSAFKDVKLWERCSVISSAIKFYVKDSSGNESYWDITTNGTVNTWQQDTLDLSTPDGNNGTNATLSDIVEFGFQGLDASETYILDTIKAICGLSVAIEGSTPGSFYKQVYAGSQPVEMVTKASPSITPPSVNPRIDILTVNSSGTLAWVTGTEAASPVPDWASLAKDVIPICLVYCKTTMAKVVDYEDKDANPNEGYIYADLRPLYKLGVFTLLGLTDTPSSYSGEGSKYLRVNSGETAIEFVSLVLTFLTLTDTPSSYSGQANKLVGVNTGESALEFKTPPVDEKVLVSANDSTGGYLNGKLIIGDGISFTEGNDGADETLAIANTKPGLINAAQFYEPDPMCVFAFGSVLNGAPELSRYGHTVSLFGGPGYGDGKVNKRCYDFDGSNQYATFPVHAVFSGMTNLTIEAWIYRDLTGTHAILCTSTNGKIRLYIDDTNVTFYLDGATQPRTATGAHGLSGSGLTQWIYIVATWAQASIFKIYVNGSDISATYTDANIGAIDADSTDLRVGTRENGSNDFDGRIDCVRLLRRRMLAAEVLARYNAFA